MKHQNQPETDEQIGTVEFTVQDMESIASLPMPAIKPLLTADQYAALLKFVNVNQATVGMNNGTAKQ